MKTLICWSLLLAPVFASNSDTWECTLESGYLWKFGSNTDTNYEIIPTQLTLRSPVAWTLWKDETGANLVIRNRFSALLATFAQGPENHYFGIAAAPSLEYTFPSTSTSAFFSIGGGAGWADSAGGTNGLGQDLTFNWFSQLGLRHKLTENLALLGGLYFMHLSNLGMTDPNPGIDAIGFTLGCSWTF